MFKKAFFRVKNEFVRIKEFMNEYSRLNERMHE